VLAISVCVATLFPEFAAERPISFESAAKTEASSLALIASLIAEKSTVTVLSATSVQSPPERKAS
jgi:hypothetical protein